MWHCGMRISEVQELRVQDVDLPGRKLFIAQSKENKDRMIYISEATAGALAEHFAKRRQPNSPYVFTGRHGPLDFRSIHDRLGRYGDLCDVHVSPHRLRHTFASQMLAAGMSIVSLQRYMGHDNLNTTMIYAEFQILCCRRIITEGQRHLTLLRQNWRDGSWTYPQRMSCAS